MGIAQLTTGSLELANRAVQLIAEDIFDPTNRRPAVYDEFTEVGTVGGELTIEHQVIETFQPIQEWVAERQYREVIFAIVRGYKETWEKSFSMDRKQARSMTGEQVQARLLKWLGSPEIDLDRIVHLAAFLGNAGPTGYDGVPLWSASHPRGKDNAVQANTSGTAWSIAQHNAIVMLMASITDVYGENLGVQADTIICGARLAPTIRQFLQANRVQAINAAGVEATASVVAAASGTSTAALTVYEGNGYRLVIDPRFAIGSSLENKYLYLDSKMGVKPFHLYRGESGFAARTSLDMDNVFNQDRLQWGIFHDVILMAGAWQGAHFGGT